MRSANLLRLTALLLAAAALAGCAEGGVAGNLRAAGIGSRVALIQVYRTASPYDTVFCDVERTTTTTATIRFAAAPSSGEYTVVVMV